MKNILNSNIARYIAIFFAVIAATTCIVAAMGTITSISMELYDDTMDEAVGKGQKNLLNLYSRQIFLSKDINPEIMADSNMDYIIIKGLNSNENIFEGENLDKLKDKNNYIYTNNQSIIDTLQNGADKNDFKGIQTYYKHEEDISWASRFNNLNLIRSLFNDGYQDEAQNVYTEKIENVKSIYFDSDTNAFYFETDSYKFPVKNIKININNLDENTRNMLTWDMHINEDGKYVNDYNEEIDYIKFNVEMEEGGARYYYDNGYYDYIEIDLSKYVNWEDFYVNDFRITPKEVSMVYKELPYYHKHLPDSYTSYINKERKENLVENEAINIRYNVKDGFEECFVILSNVKDNLNEDVKDLFIPQKKLITFLYDMRIAMIVIMLTSAVIFIILFVFCCYSRYVCSVLDTDVQRIKKGIIHRIPLIIYIMAVVLTIVADIYLLVVLLNELLLSEVAVNSLYIVMSLYLIFIFIAVYLAILIFMEIICRAGAGILLKNTACYYCIKLTAMAYRGLKKLTDKCINKIRKYLNYFGKNTSFTKKMILFLVLFDIVSILLIAFIIGTGSFFILMLAGIIFNIIVVIVGFWLSNLQNQAKQLADGDLNCKVDTSKMFWELKKHGDYLNQISGAISLAVKEKMKSEHFKTELITNVSHDIKTPLTSIINYVDLLDRENISQPKAEEYIEVLKRQSAKLKKLIEDLMEASKASTGNININLELCNINILFTQMIGEYEEKIRDAGMETVVESGDKDIFIMADNRHIWRIFDNILNNICKYGQNGTRVYINLETIEDFDSENISGKVNIIFRNISKYRLNISKDELLERFVRGDGSRHTEGNGLGLSIAQNLAELMNGKLDIDIDGDLFKVVLTFPAVE